MSKTDPALSLSQPFVGVHLRYNRTASGRRSTTAARGVASYVAYGRPSLKETTLRGEWEGPDGRRCEHEDVLTWIQAESSRHRYTVHAVLSTAAASLPPAAYREALAQGGQSDDYRLMVHLDTDYNHAHVLFFWDKRLEKERFLEWQTNVRDRLAQREWEQLNGQALEPADAATAVQQTAVQGAGLETSAANGVAGDNGADIADEIAFANSAAANLDLAYSGGGYDYS